ncbi:MAG: hypothetical protein U0232_19080 [Thermomicrobiales bacterium]
MVEDRALFAGDTVVTGIVPAIGQGDSRQMEASLRRLAALEIAITGVGARLRRSSGRRACATGWRGGEVIWCGRANLPARLAQGHPERSPRRPILPVHRRPAVDRHNMPKRHRDTVAKIAREVVVGALRGACGGG